MKLSQNLQLVLDDWSRITGLSYCLLNPSLSPFLHAGSLPSLDKERLQIFIDSPALSMGSGDCSVQKIMQGDSLRYLLLIQGENKSLPSLSELAFCQVQSLIDAYAPKEDKNVFLRDLLLGECPAGEIEARARQLHISTDSRRVLFYVQTKTPQNETALTMIKSLFQARSKDYVLPLGDSVILILREIHSTDTTEGLEGVAHMLIDMLATEAMTSSWVSYSNISTSLEGLHKAYQEAHMALEVGKLFYGEKNIFPYGRLGIGRLIYMLPKEVCEVFVDEIFGGRDLSDIDEDTLSTIRLHFENNLNISETARQLFVHRNTLVYRFEKIEKRFGLDLKTFEDAVTFKIGLMVLDYLGHNNPPLPS